MRKLTLTLSFVCLSSCGVAPFPSDPLFVVDLASQVCVEYEIINSTELIYRLREEHPLVALGPCDRLAGWARDGAFKRVQNWARDQIKEGQ